MGEESVHYYFSRDVSKHERLEFYKYLCNNGTIKEYYDFYEEKNHEECLKMYISYNRKSTIDDILK